MDSDKNLELEIEKELEEEILFDAIKEEVEEENTQKSFENKEKNSKPVKKRKKYKLRKGIQVRTVIILLITLIVNTYAWFIYVSTVSTSLSMHIKDWKFELSSGDQNQNFDFLVDDIYPGITEKETAKEISAVNSSIDTTAVLSCELSEVRILNDEFKVGDTYTKADGTTAEYTSDDLLNILYRKVDYPAADKKEGRTHIPFDFKIYLVEGSGATETKQLYDTDTEYEMISGKEIKIRMQIVWDYETYLTNNEVDVDKDSNDTAWGIKSYEFSTNPDTKDQYSVVVKMNVKAVQKLENANP